MTREDDLRQAMRVLDEPGSEPYTLTPDDIRACRGILRQLIRDDQVTGGYGIGTVQGYTGKAQVMVEFAKRCDALSSGEIAARTADSAARLGSLCRKVIAHYDTQQAKQKAVLEHVKLLEERLFLIGATKALDAAESLCNQVRDLIGEP